MFHRLTFYGAVGLACIAAGLLSCGPKAAPQTTGDVAQGASPPSDMDTPLPCPADSRQGPIVVWAADALQERWGAGWSRIDEVHTSKARPIEVCGVREQVDWLVSLRCPDGRKAFANSTAAHGARAGSAGQGGRCGTTIDQYVVSCGAVHTVVFADLYHCGPGESPYAG